MDETFGIDGHKLHYHPHRVAQWLDAKDDWEKAKKVYPLYFEVTTSGACNHRCTFCSVDGIGYKPILADAGLLIARMREAAALGVKSVMFAGTGEPMVHKSISRIVDGAVDAGLDAAFTTNGTLLHTLEPLHRCTWIKVSLNAGSPEGYAAIHRTKITDWDKVWENLKDAGRRKGKCTLGVQSVVLPDNIHEMRGLAAMCASTKGIDYLVLKPYTQANPVIQVGTKYKGTTYDKWHPQLMALSEFDTDTFKVIYRQRSMKQESEAHKYPVCNATPFFWVYAMANGDVYTCSDHLMEKEFCIGNLYEQTFQEIWEGEKRRENWERMKTFNIKYCRLNCRMDKQNKYLHDFSTIKHINWI